MANIVFPSIHNFGKLNLSVYDFKEVDDILPTHQHTDIDVHISIVARGSFRAHGDGWEKTLKTGDVVDWPAFYNHEFVALEPDSRLVNIIKA